MAHIGYIRTSAVEKNPVRQLDGVALDAIFADTSGGTSRTRKGLTECLSRLCEGDVCATVADMVKEVTSA